MRRYSFKPLKPKTLSLIAPEYRTPRIAAPKKGLYLAHDGPYHDAMLPLHQGTTAVFRVCKDGRQWIGRYVCGEVAQIRGPHRRFRSVGTTHWKDKEITS